MTRSKSSVLIAGLVLGASLLTPSGILASDQATQDLYKERCQKCHGADGKGDTPAGKKLEARDFHSPEFAKMTDAELIKVTTDGKKKMPAFKEKLSGDEIKALIAYIRQLSKK
jgi:cytochrome c6